jgi:hypothetical protein
MENTDTSAIAGWFAGRVPGDWFTGPPEVTLEGEQIVVVGPLAPVALGSDAGEQARSAAGRGRIARFRGETRRERIWIAREAEELFKKNVTWGARAGDVRETFTPGGSGRSDGEKTVEGASVTIGRRWGRGVPGFGGFRRGRFAGGPPGDRRLF